MGAAPVWAWYSGGMAAAGGLSLRTKMGYGVGDVGGNLFFTIMGFWLLNFVTDTLGLAASLAGRRC